MIPVEAFSILMFMRSKLHTQPNHRPLMCFGTFQFFLTPDLSKYCSPLLASKLLHYVMFLLNASSRLERSSISTCTVFNTAATHNGRITHSPSRIS